MAIPNDSLSDIPITDFFLYPDNLDDSEYVRYEAGGIGLSDTTAGLRYQVWTCRYEVDTENVVIQSATLSPTVLFNQAGITEMDFTFDQNMRPFVCYVANGTATFWWYDTDLGGTTFTNLPAGSQTPRCALDDKRETQTNSSDIILAYILSGNLYYREQRERYIDQHLLQAGVVHPTTGNPAILRRIGMHGSLRLQFLLHDPNYQEFC